MGMVESLDERFATRAARPDRPERTGEGEGDDEPRRRPARWAETLRRLRNDDRVRWAGVVAVLTLVVAGLVLRRDGRPVDDLLPLATSGSVGPTTSAGAGSSGGAADPLAASSTSGAPTEIVVHVAGQVLAPGLVRLAPGSRVADAVAAAGGPGTAADLDRLNLAAPLADGQRVEVAAVGDPPDRGGVSGTAGPAPGAPGPGGDPDQGAPVDLNSADGATLETLPGVGPATAEAIIAYRDANGPFRSVDELLEVRGIGPAKLEAIAERATVGP